MQVDKIITTTSSKETQKIGEDFAKEILKKAASAKASAPEAIIFGLSGNLGGGKTTFLQGFAKGLGIKEKVLSPTFVVQKRFPIKNGNFYHIDCYRLKDEKDILEIGWEKIIKDPKNIVAVEWPEIIKKVLPKDIMEINFNFVDEDTREISFKK